MDEFEVFEGDDGGGAGVEPPCVGAEPARLGGNNTNADRVVGEDLPEQPTRTTAVEGVGDDNKLPGRVLLGLFEGKRGAGEGSA